MTRQQWEDLPVSVRERVELECGGPVIKAEPAGEGTMPGVAARLQTDNHSVFIKAVEAAGIAAKAHRTESWAASVLPDEAPAPHLLWRGQQDGWLVTLFEYINDNSRHVDLTPGSPDLPAVLDTVALLGALLTPCPRGGAPVIDNILPLLAKDSHLRDKGIPADRDLYDTAIERFEPSDLRGNTLLHYDLGSSNMLISQGSVYVIDWSYAARGAAWIDAAMLAPRLVEAGHTPPEVDELLSRVPSWTSAPPDAVIGLAALWTRFRIYKARYGPEEMREFRARAAVAGKTWLSYRQSL
ncbi:phosphotransferase family protein [Nonomuraea sp. NEAU-A123]|uniref:phosphotransferase family protein n=1 Tax=Nonomuraea sp. NEAU-A123 TaxID=2839649 RepID=UPI001BE42EC0|nr:phosphotransferase [Nonomuraea sp. NEAU-A123]MBT2229550.1 phosphotransferase [Nonomuraea sp. NEAU-A123]